MTETLNMLQSLARLDVDAWHAYKQALENIGEADIRQKLSSFQEDHRQHFETISGLIEKFGSTAPEFSRDFKGFLIEGFTSLRSVTGSQGALEAMKSNESLTNRKYRDALNQGSIPSDVKSVLERHYKDEKKHLEYIRRKAGLIVEEKDTPDRSQYY